MAKMSCIHKPYISSTCGPLGVGPEAYLDQWLDRYGLQYTRMGA